MVPTLNIVVGKRRQEFPAELAASPRDENLHLRLRRAGWQAMVVSPVKVPEFRLLAAAPPGLIALVPGHRAAQSLGKADRSLPAEGVHACNVKRVPVVVAGPILHEVLQR